MSDRRHRPSRRRLGRAARRAAERVLRGAGLDGLVGSPQSVRVRLSGRRAPVPLREALDRLAPHAGAGDPSERPVLVLASAWRSGSTLLQRVLMSDPECLVWGEPYDRCAYVQRLAATLRAFNDAWPPPHYLLPDAAGGPDPDEWTANLYPGVGHLLDAHRTFLRRLLAEPAAGAGFSRWGMKEVRLTADHATYLRMLFPGARLVLLHRNPYHAFASYTAHAGWEQQWPRGFVATPGQFGRHWRERTEGWLARAGELGALVLGFDELAGDREAVERIGAHVDLRLDPAVVDRQVPGQAGGPRPRELSRIQVRRLARWVEPVAGELGYRP